MCSAHKQKDLELALSRQNTRISWIKTEAQTSSTEHVTLFSRWFYQTAPAITNNTNTTKRSSSVAQQMSWGLAGRHIHHCTDCRKGETIPTGKICSLFLFFFGCKCAFKWYKVLCGLTHLKWPLEELQL